MRRWNIAASSDPSPRSCPASASASICRDWPSIRTSSPSFARCTIARRRTARGCTGTSPVIHRRNAEVADNLPPSRQDWPCLGAMVSRFRTAPAGLPSAIQVPYSLVDNNTLQAGDNAGFLGQTADPIVVRPDRGRPWGGISRDLGAMVLQRAEGIDMPRLTRQAKPRAACSITASVHLPTPTTIFDKWPPTCWSAPPCKPRSISTANRSACVRCTAITSAAKACSWPGGWSRLACRSSRSSVPPAISTAARGITGTRTAITSTA